MDDGRMEGAGSAALPDLERATYDGSAPGGGSCQSCGRPLGASYFQIDGRAACADCRDKVVASGDSSGLSARERFLMACVYGGGAALLGSVAWYLVARVTGLELGIIAIGVGLLVGAAVRKGSRGRGGRGYQALAMVLTYLSIVSSYVPSVIAGLQESAAKSEAASSDKGAAPDPGAPADRPGASAGAPAKPPEKPWNHGVAFTLVVMCALVLGLAIAAPFLAGASNFMGWLIIGIALYEAWKINRRVAPQILGPFSLATAAVAPDPAAAAAGAPPASAP
jgi:hypothetical protein